LPGCTATFSNARDGVDMLLPPRLASKMPAQTDMPKPSDKGLNKVLF
jgi:hypothetical protein